MALFSLFPWWQTLVAQISGSNVVIESLRHCYVNPDIKLLESPIPAATASSQKAHFDDISGTKRGTIDPLVSKRPEKILNKKIQNSKKKNVENGQKWSKMVKMVKMV